MGEALTGLERSCMCCDVNESMIGQEVTVMGWVQRRLRPGSADFHCIKRQNGSGADCNRWQHSRKGFVRKGGNGSQ